MKVNAKTTRKIETAFVRAGKKAFVTLKWKNNNKKSLLKNDDVAFSDEKFLSSLNALTLTKS